MKHSSTVEFQALAAPAKFRTAEAAAFAENTAAHLLDCTGCGKAYLEFVRPGGPWGLIDPSPTAPPHWMAETEDYIYSRVRTALVRREFHFSSLVYDSPQRATAIESLGRLRRRFEAEGKAVEFCTDLSKANPKTQILLLIDPPLALAESMPGNESQAWIAVLRKSVANRPGSPFPKYSQRLVPDSTHLRAYVDDYCRRFKENVKEISPNAALAFEFLSVSGQYGVPMCQEHLKRCCRDMQPCDFEDALLALLQQRFIVQIRKEPQWMPADPYAAGFVLDPKSAVARRSEWSLGIDIEASGERESWNRFLNALADEGEVKDARSLFLRRCPSGAGGILQHLGISHEFLAWGVLVDQLRIPSADKILQRGLEKEPENPYLAHSLAMHYARQAKFLHEAYPSGRNCAQAIRIFERMSAASEPKSMPAQLAAHARIHLAWSLNEFRSAEYMLRKLDPQPPAAPYWLSLESAIAVANGAPQDMPQKIAEWRKTGDPDCAFADLLLAELAQTRHRLPEALKHLEALLRNDEHNIRALHLQAHILRDRGHLRAASASLDRLLEIAPTNEYARHLQADIRAENGDLSGLRSLDLNRFEAAIALCDWMLKLGSPLDEIDETLKRVTPSDHPRAQSILGRLRMAQGRTAEGLAILLRVKDSRREPATMYQYALACGRIGKFNEALQWALESDVHSLNTRALVLRLKAAELKGQDARAASRSIADALDLYRESLRIDAENTYTMRGKAAALRQNAALREAGSDIAEKLLGEANSLLREVRKSGLPEREPAPLYHSGGTQ